MARRAAAPTEAVRLCLKVQIAVGLGHDAGALQTQEQRPQRHDVARVGRGIVRLRDDAGLLVDVLEDGAVVLQRLLARVVEHLAHVLWLSVSDMPCREKETARHVPHPYSMCAIWLLGTMLPFAFLTILGEASAAALEATVTVSMVPAQARRVCGCSSSPLHAAVLGVYRRLERNVRGRDISGVAAGGPA